MLWIIIASLPLLLLCWLLLSPVELRIDSRIPEASVHLTGIGKALFVFEDEEWWLKIQVFFFKKKWSFFKLINSGKKKKEPSPKTSKRKRKHKRIGIRKIFTLIRTFRVVNWEIAIDSNDPLYNAWLYAFNFSPYTHKHININFQDLNYFTITIKNAAWRLLFAWIR